jgi:copper transport protein
MTVSRSIPLVLTLTALGLLLSPVRASAHAHLKRSEPAAGSKLRSSPQLIRFWFSEAPELSMTSISLKDPNGRQFPLGPPESDRGDPLTISIHVSQPLPAGRYSVAWRTAASDGHPSHGTFSFVVLEEVGLPADAAAASQLGATKDTLTSENLTAASSTKVENEEEASEASSVTTSLARTLTFVGLLVLIGATTFRTLILPRARGISVDLNARMARRAAILGVAAGVLVIVTAFARLSLEAKMISAMPGMQTMSLTDMAMHTRWGFALRLELGAAFVVLVAFAHAAARIRGAWLVASLMAIVLAITPALAGHAAASPRFTSLMIVTDFLHVLGGASWLGSLFAVVVVGIPLSLTLDGVERWSAVASLVNSFSPLALVSAAVVIVSGITASWVHLEHLSALWQTAYGEVLLLKLLLVAMTLTIGAYNFRRVQPRLVHEVGSAHLRRSAAVELSFAFLILAVTGFLTGISP